MEEKELWKQAFAVVEQLTENVSRLISNSEQVLALEERTLALFDKLKDRVEVNAGEAKRRDEAMERNIEFIIQQQAKFTTDMGQLRESQVRSEQRWERAERMWTRTEESIRALLALAESHEGEINALQEAQARLTESQAQTDRQMAETDERINALVGAVEALISERRNGGGAERREG